MLIRGLSSTDRGKENEPKKERKKRKKKKEKKKEKKKKKRKRKKKEKKKEKNIINFYIAIYNKGEEYQTQVRP